MDKNIVQTIEKLSKLTLVDVLQEGFIDLENKDLTSLEVVADYILENYTKCFWGYCFKAIVETGIDISKPIDNLSYQLKNKDIQEDIKARLYFNARIKYVKAPASKYEAICGFYPDIPGERRNEWYRSKTAYDSKLNQMLVLQEKYKLIESKYLDQLRIYSVSEKEVAIVHNIELWGKYISHAIKSLQDYNDKAENFVKQDFKKTPNPGNKKGFIVYTIFLLLSILLALSGTTRSVLALILQNQNNFAFNLTFSIISSVLLILVSAMFIMRSKIFSKLNPIFASFLILLEVIVASLNIVSVFTRNELDVFVSFFISAVGIIGIIGSLYKTRYYFPRNTYKCGSYIGNYKALCTNKFKVDFNYEWKPYLEGSELEVGDIASYLSPYIGQ